MKKTRENIQVMLDIYPQLEETLRIYNPELFEKQELFVSPGVIFMRKNHRYNLYTLSHHKFNGFRIIDIRDNKAWSKWIPASIDLDDIGLTKWDFKQLLKSSGVKLSSIKFVGINSTTDIYEKLFNNNR